MMRGVKEEAILCSEMDSVFEDIEMKCTQYDLQIRNGHASN